MILRKNRFLAVSALIFCASLVFSISAMARPAAARAAADASQGVKRETAYYCIAKEYMGKVGIFSPQSEVPLRVLDVWVNDLPEADREQLRVGMGLLSEESLWALIEDYSS